MPLKKSSVKLSSKESKKSKPMSPVNKRASIKNSKQHNKKLLKEFKQRQQRQTLEIRQDALNKKQAYLNQLFDEVVLKMSEWSAEEFQEFMKAQLGSLELTGKATILLGE